MDDKRMPVGFALVWLLALSMLFWLLLGIWFFT